MALRKKAAKKAPEAKIEQDPSDLLGGLGDAPATVAKPEAKPKAKKKGPRDPSELRQTSVVSYADRLKESRTALEAPLEVGQALFEAPDGFVMVGDAEENHIWCRWMENGKGGWINKRR